MGIKLSREEYEKILDSLKLENPQYLDNFIIIWQAATLAAEETFNQRLVELTSRIRELEADAKRYRWLRDKHWVQEEAEFRLNLSDTELQNVYHDELNKAIDAALMDT